MIFILLKLCLEDKFLDMGLLGQKDLFDITKFLSKSFYHFAVLSAKTGE